MTLPAILVLGFLLGVRHATDADHVVAVSTIVGRERTLRAAAPIGILWGVGHTLTILLVGGAILVFGVVIPPRLGLMMELGVAVMLVLLGAVSLGAGLRDSAAIARGRGPGRSHVHRTPAEPAGRRSFRPLWVGIVHGLAGSGAVTLLVLGTISNLAWGIAYLLIFGLGTIAGMFLITILLAVPFVLVADRFRSLRRTLGTLTGLASVALGTALIHEIGFVGGLFTVHPHWVPH